MDTSGREAALPSGLLEAVVRSLPHGLLVIDRAGRFVYANPAAERVLGRAWEEIVGRDGRDSGWRFTTVDGTAVPAESLPFVRMKQTGESLSCEEYVVDCGDGRRVSVYLSAAQVSDGGEAIGVVVMLVDRDHGPSFEESFRKFLDQVPDAVAVHRGGRVVYVNAAAGAALGYDRPEEIVGRPVEEFIPPEDREVVRERIRRAVQLGEPAPLREEQFIRKDGSRVTFEVMNLPHLFEGQPSVVVFGRDVTARKQHEAERERLLREVQDLARVAQRKAAELGALLDAMIDPVCAADVQGRIVLLNQAARRLAGEEGVEILTLSDLCARVHPRRLDGTPLSAAELPLARAVGGETVRLEDMVVDDAATRRERIVRSNAVPIRNGEGKVVGAVEVLRDVTESVELDRLKDQFIRVAAHELKTPVAIIKGYSQLLLRRGKDLDPGYRKVLRALVRGADRIDRIVEDLLYISQLEVGRMQLVLGELDLSRLVERVVERAAMVAPRHQIRIVHREPAVVLGDRQRLEYVLNSLVDNAVRYSPKGGDVEIESRVQGGEVMVAVRDHGVGIPKEKQSRIFQRFYRAHTDTPYDYGGMGVALYISKAIIEKHGGRIGFESQEGVGSRFYFTLPLRRPHGG